MRVYIYQCTYYNKHILRLVTQEKNGSVPAEAVQIARRIFQPDKRPGCEVITLDQVRFVRSLPPHPKMASNLCRALSAAGYVVYR